MKKAIAVVMLSLLILSVSGLSSCRNKTERKKGMTQLEMSQMDTINTEIEKNVYPLPTSAEVIKVLSELEVGYIIGISNPVDNAKKYLTSTQKAINIGVFGADLSYATLYNIQQEVIHYLDAIRSLADELNMSKIYDESLYDRIRQNVDNKNELVKILKDAFNNTYGFLSDNDEQPLAILMVGGAWVEGMYLTTHVSEAAYQIAGISKVLLTQKKSFDLFLEITQQYMDDVNIKEFVEKMDPVKRVYSGLGTSLTNQDIVDITRVIGNVRSQIVQ